MAGEAEELSRRRPPLFANFGRLLLDTLQIFGECTTLFLSILRHLGSVVRQRDKIFTNLVVIGTDTLGITALVSLFVGMVMVVQAADQLQNYTQEILGSFVGLAMTKELGPVLVGFLVAGKSGSAITAEIGAMKVYEEISALRTMDIDPIPYLTVPRFVATTLAVPMLVLYSDVIGIFGGSIVVALDPTISIGVPQYFDNLREWVNSTDIAVGLIKGVSFGVIIATVSCAFGFRTTGGSEGIAKATTSAVVWSFVLIIIADFLLVRFAFLFFPGGPQ